MGCRTKKAEHEGLHVNRAIFVSLRGSVNRDKGEKQKKCYGPWSQCIIEIKRVLFEDPDNEELSTKSVDARVS